MSSILKLRKIPYTTMSIKLQVKQLHFQSSNMTVQKSGKSPRNNIYTSTAQRIPSFLSSLSGYTVILLYRYTPSLLLSVAAEIANRGVFIISILSMWKRMGTVLYFSLSLWWSLLFYNFWTFSVYICTQKWAYSVPLKNKLWYTISMSPGERYITLYLYITCTKDVTCMILPHGQKSFS